MAGGYDKFFKDAQKARGLSNGTSSGKPKASAKKKVIQFPIKHKKGESPEDHIRAELALRMRNKRNAARKPKAKFPVMAAVTTILLFAGGVFGYLRGDLVEEVYSNTLGRLEFGAFGAAEASDKPAKAGPDSKEKSKEKAAEKAADTKDLAPAKTAESSAHDKQKEITNTKSWTSEELSFFGKLNERKNQLDLREAELAKLDEELHKRKAELDEKLKQLESMRGEISKTLKTRVASDHEKVDKLVQVYSTMKPQQASKIIETLDEDLAVEILDNMKKKSAAEILNMMDAKKARRLSELSTGYERSAASVKNSETKEE